MSQDRVALVTAGAGMGIGSAIVRRLAEDGFRVVVTDAHERRSGELAATLTEQYGRPFLSRVLDVTDPSSVERVMDNVVDELGGLDVLVNNAGWSKIEPIAEMSLETWQKCLDVDLTGTFLCMRYALPHMIRGGGGSIVNISSISAYETSVEHGGAYSAAKAGVLALTRVAAAENGRHNVRVNAVTPGLIYNEFLRKIYPDEFFDGYAENRSLVGRVGRPEDVAAVVAFLVSEGAGYVTGETYGVSGGVFPHA
jgi:3-oxoacyl-[acyl-carrier protein] reductase